MNENHEGDSLTTKKSHRLNKEDITQAWRMVTNYEMKKDNKHALKMAVKKNDEEDAFGN